MTRQMSDAKIDECIILARNHVDRVGAKLDANLLSPENGAVISIAYSNLVIVELLRRLLEEKELKRST